MKRTLLVTLDFYPSIGGVSRYWEYLGDELPPDQFVVLAPLLPKNSTEHTARYAIVRWRMIARWLFPHWLPLMIAVYRTCRRYRIERMIAAQILPVGIAVSLVGRILRIPYLVSAHGMDLEFAKKKRRKLAVSKKILRRSERVIVNAATTGRAVTSFGVPQSKIEYIYPAPVITPTLLTSKRTAIPAAYLGKKILLTVSRLVQRKGHELVLQALPGILAEMPDVLYCVIGDGPYRSILETRTRELGIEHAVVFTGVLTDAEIAQWYDACTLFIMAPEDIDGDVEGFGIVYLEANSFGKPVIGARTGGVAEAVHDGVTGILVDQKSVTQIQEATVRILRDPVLAARLGDAGKRRVAEEFSWKKQAEKLQYLLSL